MTIMPSRPKPRINWFFFFFLSAKEKKSLQKETQDKLNLVAVCYEMVGQDEQLIIKIE